jgi:hypothetical protein
MKGLDSLFPMVLVRMKLELWFIFYGHFSPWWAGSHISPISGPISFVFVPLDWSHWPLFPSLRMIILVPPMWSCLLFPFFSILTSLLPSILHGLWCGYHHSMHIDLLFSLNSVSMQNEFYFLYYGHFPVKSPDIQTQPASFLVFGPKYTLYNINKRYMSVCSCVALIHRSHAVGTRQLPVLSVESWCQLASNCQKFFSIHPIPDWEPRRSHPTQ